MDINQVNNMATQSSITNAPLPDTIGATESSPPPSRYIGVELNAP